MGDSSLESQVELTDLSEPKSISLLYTRNHLNKS